MSFLVFCKNRSEDVHRATNISLFEKLFRTITMYSYSGFTLILVLCPFSFKSSISRNCLPLKCLVKGSNDFWRNIKITAYPNSKKYSAEAPKIENIVIELFKMLLQNILPLVPAEKLSTNRTVLCSNGIDVPPL